MATHGKIGEFDPENDDWELYAERVKFYFEAHGITNVEKRRAILLTAMGNKSYKLLRSLVLVAPNPLTEKTFDELVKISSANDESIKEYLFGNLQNIESNHPNCGITLIGDFNRLNITNICRHFGLKQVVKFPTRGDATLDLILTNISEFYSEPKCYPPLGLSDHCTIHIAAKQRRYQQEKSKYMTLHGTRPSYRASLGRYLSNINWLSLTDLPTCKDKLLYFTDLVFNGVNSILPKKSVKIRTNEPPWITIKFKSLLKSVKKHWQEPTR